jgi:hypothetical protein
MSLEAAERGLNLGEGMEKHYAGAKAQPFYLHLAARLKSCPDAYGLVIWFFSGL